MQYIKNNINIIVHEQMQKRGKDTMKSIKTLKQLTREATKILISLTKLQDRIALLCSMVEADDGIGYNEQTADLLNTLEALQSFDLEDAIIEAEGK